MTGDMTETMNMGNMGNAICNTTWVACIYIHCSKYLRDQIFKAIYLEIYWEKSFQIVVLFSWIILLDNAVVGEKKLANFIFDITQRGITPKTQVYQSHRDVMTFTPSHVQTL